MPETIDRNVFDRIHHSVDMLNSLHNCRDTFVLDREKIDERLFEELNNFETFVKQFEDLFIKVLMEDLKAISKAAVINSNNSEKAKELVDAIHGLMNGFSRMESDSIAKSQSLLRVANESKQKLALIRKEMESQLRNREKGKKDLNSAMAGVPQSFS